MKMKMYNFYSLKKRNCTIATHWRNEIVQLLHIEEMKLYNYYTLKKWNCTITTHWKKWNCTISTHWRN